MPCHRLRDTSFALPVSAAGEDKAPGSLAVPSVATERARPACPERGGQGFSQVRIGSLVFCSHTAKQQERAGLSNETETGQACVEPSRAERIGAGVLIVLAVLLPLAAMFLGVVS
jgi:hypothetical protein